MRLRLRTTLHAAFPGGLRRPFLIAALPFLLAGAGRAGQSPQDPPARVDRAEVLRDISILAHDSMEGRRAGTPGGERARNFLLAAFAERGLAQVNGTFVHPFQYRGGGGATDATGVNLLGLVRGREIPDRYIVITAHYDHLGVRGGEIYNGADDNASGSAALLSLARYFTAHPTRHSLLFVAFDAEEAGLRGAEALVADPPIPLGSILLNVNMDMISRNEAGELFAVGTRHYPKLTPLVEEAARRSRITLRTGHDVPGPNPSDDWTFASDHGAFHQAKIPFIYFGVEDHADYHRPSDTFEGIDPDFYLNAVETVLDFILLADEGASEIQ